MTDRPIVAVIGAGFSGVLTALRLLLAADGPRVLLIERGPRFGRGAAYATTNPDHLLNVRATNMSAFVEEPSHFLDWLAAAGVAEPDRVFVTRDRYGQYLQSLLRKAAADGRAAGRLSMEHDDVRALTRDGEAWRVHLALGRGLSADAVVLALGNLPPPAPAEIDEALIASGHYVADPWAWNPAGVPAGGDILLLGSGLTAVDIALSIQGKRPDTSIVALSRRGLLPRPHGDAASPTAAARAPKGSPLDVLIEVRRRATGDWRGAIDALRPYVQTLWRGWSVKERLQFLRHSRPWWDVHRHRLAPEVAARVEAFQRAGLLSIVAGRLRDLRAGPDGVEAAWTARGGQAVERRTFALVVNCAGPRGDLAQCGDPLVAGLLAAGDIRPDACRLGVDVDSRSRAIGADGAARETLFAVGPITHGQFYEITSVPDIRIQAADCAGAILNVLSLRARHQPSREAGAERLVADLSTLLTDSIDELDVEPGGLKFARRVRNAWELRGRRAALGEIALWLDERRGQKPLGDRR
ncbi:MAG: FAD-dependent oxidoreductase [Caulobacteraceae bacterium]